MIDKTPAIPQAAVIPIKDGQVCLVKSSSGKQWITPKGHIELDEMAEETAAREAWEEAGLVGIVEEQSVGEYCYEKCGRNYRVTVFVMQVLEVLEDWPERDRRPRRWLPPLQAMRAIGQPRLRDLVAQVAFNESAELSA